MEEAAHMADGCEGVGHESRLIRNLYSTRPTMAPLVYCRALTASSGGGAGGGGWVDRFIGRAGGDGRNSIDEWGEDL